MTNPHLEHLELLAQVDELVDQLAKWSNDSDLPWTPVRQARRLVDRRLVDRLVDRRGALLAAEAAREQHVLARDGGALGVDGAEVRASSKRPTR